MLHCPKTSKLALMETLSYMSKTIHILTKSIKVKLSKLTWLRSHSHNIYSTWGRVSVFIIVQIMHFCVVLCVCVILLTYPCRSPGVNMSIDCIDIELSKIHILKTNIESKTSTLYHIGSFKCLTNIHSVGFGFAYLTYGDMSHKSYNIACIKRGNKKCVSTLTLA